jgi:D-proline reductase (dithiol) PrdB
VGLVQRQIEAAGISTITLSSIPDLTSAVSVPRLAAIEHPLGYLLGQPGDREGQTAVLLATLRAMAEMETPGSVANLPFEWPDSARRLTARPPKAPPITRYLLRHPWHIPNILSRDVPAGQDADLVEPRGASDPVS